MTGEERPTDESKTPDRDWRSQHLWQWQPVRDVLLIAGLLLVFWVGYQASIVTVPLLLAILLAYLVEPVVKLIIERTRFDRRVASAAVLVVGIAVVAIPTIVGSAYAVIEGGQLARSVASSAQRVIDSVEKPDNERLESMVPEGGWRTLRDLLVDARRRNLVREALAPQEDAPSPNAQDKGGSGVAPPQGTGDGAGGDSRNGAEIHLEIPDELAQVLDPDDPDASGQTDGAQSPEPDDPLAAELSITIPPALASVIQSTVRWVADNARTIGSRAVSTGAGAVEIAFEVLGGATILLFNLFLTCFFFFFVSSGWGSLLKLRDDVIPDRGRERALDLLAKFDRAVAGFVRGRLTIAVLQGIVFTVGYWMVGVPGWYILGPAVAILSIVPYLAVVGIPISIALLWVETNTGFRDTWWWTIAAPMVVYYTGQFLDDYFFTPVIQGKETGLDTPTILFATFAGGALMGIYGLLLAIPLAACIKILIVEVAVPRFKRWARGDASDFLPIDEGKDTPSREKGTQPPDSA